MDKNAFVPRLPSWLLGLALLATHLGAPLADPPAPEAGSTAVTEHVTLALLAEQEAVQPGAALWLGLRFDLQPEWHVYWRNPGDSGTAPTVSWDLPPGWNAGEIHWPVPERIRVGHLTNYGYEHGVTYLVPVSVPPQSQAQAPDVPAPAGLGTGAGTPNRVRIEAFASWLVCREECIPEEARLAVEVEMDEETRVDPDVAAHFETVRARWPAPAPGEAAYRIEDGRLVLALEGLGLEGLAPKTGDAGGLWFAAHDWGPVNPSGDQGVQFAPGGLRLSVPLGEAPPDGTAALVGLLVREPSAPGMQATGFTLQARPAAAPSGAAHGSLVTALAFALVGGLILNLMPCVLPVLSIKIMGFVHEAHSGHGRLATHGLVFLAGVLLTFAVAAGLLLVLRAGGELLGWGFQLQSPAIVALLAYLLLLVALNLSGVFDVGAGLMGMGQGLANRGGGQAQAPAQRTAAGSEGKESVRPRPEPRSDRLLGTFASGVLAVLVASPCTAPFMATALGYALTRPMVEAFAVFLALGVGFALPVLLLSLWPAWTRFIPKPGGWMRKLQELLAFPMYASVAWLVWVLSQQTSPSGLAAALGGLVLVGLAAWLYGQARGGPRHPLRLAAAASGLAALLLLPAETDDGAAAAPASGVAAAQAWSPERVATLRAEGRPVFVNFTAAWCITCKLNEQVALSTTAVTAAMERKGIAYLKGDWTRRDPAITEALAAHGRSGVPLYLLYPADGGSPLVLPQLLTEAQVLQAIARI